MSVNVKGLEQILEGLEKKVGVEKVESNVRKACLIAERSAKEKAPKGRTGDLKKYIESDVVIEDTRVVGKIYSTLEYAPYVEYGTGLYAEEGGRKDVPWAYEDEVTGELIWTAGQHPKPFMRPALDENRLAIIEQVLEGIS